MTKPTFSCELTPYSFSTLRIVTSLLSLSSLLPSLESPVSLSRGPAGFFLCLVKVVVVAFSSDDVVVVSVVVVVLVVVAVVVVVAAVQGGTTEFYSGN